MDFHPNWAQKRVVAEVELAARENRPARIIVLKARQLGISTVTEGILFAMTTTRAHTNSVVVAHDGPSSEHLFNITKHFYETWEYREMLPHRYATKRQLSFDKLDSNIWVMTAEHTEAGRGRTIHAAHFSEVAFWGEPQEAMLAFNAAIPPLPGTLIVMESTANGMGNFFEEEWISAKTHESDYVALFFPWWQHYEYIPCQGYHCTDGTCRVCQEQAVHSGYDEEERFLVKLGCSPAHLGWRRWAIPNRCFGSVDMFHQEFPSTDDEAFLVSGVNAFPEIHLREVYEPIKPAQGTLHLDSSTGTPRFVEDPGGPLRLYRMPSSDDGWGQYFIGADPCYGQDPERGGDWAAAQVINRHNKEQVATWHGRINPIAFAEELAKLSKFFNQAMVSVETEGPGFGTIGRLSSFPNVPIWRHRVPDRTPGKQISPNSLSWSSTWKRKQWLIGKLAESIERRDIILHDQKTYKELRGYTFYGQKGYGDLYGPATKEQHDDLVMSLGIAILCESTEPAPTPWQDRLPRHLGTIHDMRGDDLSPTGTDDDDPWAM